MFSRFACEKIVCIKFFKRISPVNSFIASSRSKSNNVSSNKLPESVQILKAVEKSSSTAALRVKTISQAMKAYLERANKHEDFLKIKTDDYEIGRLHLANMMGLNPITLTQDDIDRAIEYLLPSGLYEKKARPIMKSPIELFPKEKAAQFDNSGRPFSPFFYTTKSNYYEALHQIISQFNELDAFEDKMIEKGILEPPESSRLNLSGGEWLSLEEIKKIFLEKIFDQEYLFLVTSLTRLANHPYSFRCKDLIWKFRKDFVELGSLDAIPELILDENGRAFIEMMGYRKLCQAKVIVRGNGTGKIKINGTDISFFPRLHDREQIMYPLVFTDMLGLVDIEVDVTGVGESAQAGAIRLGISLCLRSFVQPDMVENMRLAGLLTRDRRRKGRKKPGQKGCRAKYTWKKR